jgi:hypothetical protein
VTLSHPAVKVKLLSRFFQSVPGRLSGLLPSPNGKYLAYVAETQDSNVWLLENF